MQTLILVTGQHRSGTSATAGCLARLGVELGDRLMPANHANPRGFYEDMRVVKIHDRLLADLGASWDRPRAIPAAWLDHPATRAAEGRIRRVLQTFTAGTFAIKDPRAALFMPMWARLCADAGLRLVVLEPVRKEAAVVDSLVTREGWLPDRALDVVHGYEEAIYGDLEKLPQEIRVAQISFPHELWQASVWERVAKELDVELDISRIGAVHGFLDGGLVHHG